jgi:alpha-aminoadipate/glutamate carrier protein LysW
MAICPECDAPLDLEPDDVDLDDRLSCDDCGASLKVSSLAPLEVDLDEDDDDEDDLDDEEDEEEDLDEDEETEELEEED